MHTTRTASIIGSSSHIHITRGIRTRISCHAKGGLRWFLLLIRNWFFRGLSNRTYCGRLQNTRRQTAKITTEWQGKINAICTYFVHILSSGRIWIMITAGRSLLRIRELSAVRRSACRLIFWGNLWNSQLSSCRHRSVTESNLICSCCYCSYGRCIYNYNVYTYIQRT